MTPNVDDDDATESPDYGEYQERLEETDLTDGLCDDCRREECPTCEGTGYGEGWSDDDGAEECEDCGGDGVL